MRDHTICRCEEVNYTSIMNAIQDGARTSKEIKLWTRAGMGICQGRTCRPLIDSLTSIHTKQPVPNFSHLTHQSPTRPIRLADLCQISKEGEK
ncbi:(2Fe-2S)-binding protein [Ammoniphilus sp. CFH 90114]|uniref:(2Fe-2S)-binding protein n=1 Tax=Ammoniphilus sp. CFH 90114 TaxID=2493665 RepID=UPI00100E0702|nr:(2Fe-2S)-binding protein [Ammoniphilus sp. CFH 90114]